jgi:hypothetical protein
VAYLASNESSFITCANLDINAGLFFSWTPVLLDTLLAIIDCRWNNVPRGPIADDRDPFLYTLKSNIYNLVRRHIL